MTRYSALQDASRRRRKMQSDTRVPPCSSSDENGPSTTRFHSTQDPAQIPALPAPPPAICVLLWREADAWLALHHLHGVCAHAARNSIHEALDDSDELRITREEPLETKEAVYIGALSTLASQLDAMAAEVLRLRDVRRLRRNAERTLLQKALQSHEDEVVAMGHKLSTQCRLSVSSMTTDLRLATQRQRSQLSIVMQALEACTLSESAPLPGGVTLVLGTRGRDGTDCLRTAEEFAALVRSEGPEMNTASVGAALLRMREELDRTRTASETHTAARRVKRASLTTAADDTCV